MRQLLAKLAVLWAPLAVAEDAPKPDYTKAASICQLIDAAAEKHGLPKPFFARLIWKESRFDIKAVSPVGAQGVAQWFCRKVFRRLRATVRWTQLCCEGSELLEG